MKKLYVCQIADHASESIVSTFTAPTPKYFDRQMELFFKDCESKKIPVDDFEGFIIGAVDVCESFNDVESLDDDVYTYLGVTYLDSKNAAEVD